MFASVFTKTLYDQRRSLLGWGVGLVLLVAVMAAIWPSIRDMPGLEGFLANYPEAMRELFNIDAMTTGAGFLNAELYSMLLPALFIVYGVGRGARLVAGEEEQGTLETVLATPVPRWRILLEKAGALAVSVLVLGVALFLVSAAATTVADMGVSVYQLATAALAMALLGVEHAWLALAVGAATGRRAVAIAVAGTVAVGGYVLYVMGQLVEAVEPWQVLSPFHQAIEGGPIGAGLPLAYVWMLGAAVVVIAASLPVFARRDVAA